MRSSVAAVLLLLVSCADGAIPDRPRPAVPGANQALGNPQPKPPAGKANLPQHHSVGDTIRFDNISARVADASIRQYSSTTAGGRPMWHEPQLVITIYLENHDPNRIIEVGGQVDVAIVEDDVGNNYKGIAAVNELGLSNHIDGQIPSGMAHRLRPGKSDMDLLVFEEPVPSASDLTLSLQASRYGGSGSIKVTIPKRVWDQVRIAKAESKRRESEREAERARRTKEEQRKRQAEQKAREEVEAAERARKQDPELVAKAQLERIKKLLEDGKQVLGKLRLRQLTKDFPGTKAAKDAQQLLDKINPAEP